ncbi:NAD-binding protein [Fomitiporia mediterranea MF3/22]|uniref:NAD-binding protein n=1 Tax=Fomitiporia mediterranea (strain MF3/22) TaxID=694068 RepID=UPI0004407EBA|nr:NAD-binding protein [Fomitiporia mediterranea MF3/22]EJD02541.1 NAD-binding protein [Fomitiporia mediterranea MF3/22]
MATLAGKTVLVIGGSSGIGYVDYALGRLKNDVSASEATIEGSLEGEVIDAKSSDSVRALLAKVGEVDHLVWTSGDDLRLGFPHIDLDKNRDVFDVRFWGAFTAAKVAQIKPGGSITLTIGAVIAKPSKGWSLVAGIMGAADSLTRGLAVDLAPIRVNVVGPGLVKTEDTLPLEAREKMYDDAAKALPVQHVAEPDEIAEVYRCLMKCGFITDQCIEVNGGVRLA